MEKILTATFRGETNSSGGDEMKIIQKLTTTGPASVSLIGSAALFDVPIGTQMHVLGKGCCEILETKTGFVAFPQKKCAIYLRTKHLISASGDDHAECLMVILDTEEQRAKMMAVYSDISDKGIVFNESRLSVNCCGNVIVTDSNKSSLVASHDDFCRYEAEEITAEQLLAIAEKATEDKEEKEAKTIVSLEERISVLTESLNKEGQKVFDQNDKNKKLRREIQTLREDKSFLQEKLKDSRADAETSQMHIGVLLEQTEGIVTAIKNAWPTYFFGGKKPMTEDLTKAIKGANNTSKGIEKALRGEDWRVC